MNEVTITDAELVVLSLIREQDLHGYQIEQLIHDRNMRAWTDLSTSSVYYLLNKLAKRGWIEPIPDPSPSTQGAPRNVYRITEQGVQIWKEATLQALSQPRTTYTNFLMGLHNLWALPPEEARRAVQEYRSWLNTDLERQRRELTLLEEQGLSLFPVDVLFDYSFVVGEAELNFLDRLIERLRDRSSGAGPSPTKSINPGGDDEENN